MSSPQSRASIKETLKTFIPKKRIRRRFWQIFWGGLLIWMAVSWYIAQPDTVKSNLYKEFPLGTEPDIIIARLEALGFHYSLHEYKYGQFYYVSGNSQYEGIVYLRNFPDALKGVFENCGNISCTTIYGSKRDDDVFFKSYCHDYRHRWVFHDDQLIGSFERNGLWGWLKC